MTERKAYVVPFKHEDERQQMFSAALDNIARERSVQNARAREIYSRMLLERRVPRFLHWTLDRPRALRVLLRFVPRWRPTLTVVDLLSTPPPGFKVAIVSKARDVPGISEGTASEVAKLWAAHAGIDGSGYVFTYTDPQGLPAEVYGP